MAKKLFDLEEIKVSAEQPSDKAGCLAETFYNIHCEKIENIKYLVSKLPIDGEVLFLWTIQSFNAFTFIPYVLKNCGRIDELVIMTYSINIRIIDALMKQVDNGNIKKIEIFISDSIKLRLPKVYNHLESLIEYRKNIKVIYSWNHSKVTLIRSEGNYFVVEGSGNFGENAQFEQYVFLNSENVYRFRKEAISY